MRVIREQLAAAGAPRTVCVAAAQLLDALAESLRDSWHDGTGPRPGSDRADHGAGPIPRPAASGRATWAAA